MACRSCRRQLVLLTRQANAVTELQPAAALRHPSLPSPDSRRTQFDQRRNFRSTPRQSGLLRRAIAGVFQRTAEPYRVVHATEDIYKACAGEALYTIPAKDRKAGTIAKTAEGEDIGEGKTMWHEDFKLPPTFSTWSQITMLHMYLVFARLRNLEREAARSWQQQLVDHFFFDAEERMDVAHGISSRGLRQRYLKDLFVQWRGVIAAYDEGVARGDPVLAAAVWRNVYKGRADADPRAIAAVVSWMRLCLKMLDQIPDELLYTQARAVFKWRARNELTLVDIPVRQLADQLTSETPPVKKAAA
ncbi:ubiquinol-cytochrome C chaperone-domain-containing protein [Hypoxylon sp. FL1284]|nr:ubiquinol-cytochrome C chaperone-domain-containing protein [Hypoxylon sp. FL1284]